MARQNEIGRGAASITAALFLVFLAGSASAQGTLVNSQLDEDLAGCGLGPAAQPAWDPMDVDGSASSGSARLTMVGDQTCCVQGVSQYVEIEPGAEYTLSAWIQVGGDPGVGGAARVLGFWFRQSGAVCSDVAGSFLSAVVQEGEAGQWVYRQVVVQAPLDAQCMR